METVDPRDRWEYLRIRVKALGHSALVPVPSGETRSVAVLSARGDFGAGSLRELLASGKRLSPDRAVYIALGICAELSPLHRARTFHGDLKPKDVIVGPEDQVGITGGYTKNGDIGLKRGSARTDLLALGAILYEMLTGVSPSEGDQPVAPRDLNSEVSPQLQEIVCRALERVPEYRFADVAEMAWALSHPQQVTPRDRPEPQLWGTRRTSWLRHLIDAFRPLGAVAVFTSLFYCFV